MIYKPIKVPQGMHAAPYYQRSLMLETFTVVDSCTQVTGMSGSMFLKEHLLLFVLQGTYVIRHGEKVYTLGKNQMVLLKKAIVVEYDKFGEPENDNFFEGMMFFLKDDFLKEFIKKVDLPVQRSDELLSISVRNMNPQLLGFVQSLSPYFSDPDKIDAGLIKLKMLELLYGIASIDQTLLTQLLYLKQQARSDISQVLEENYMNPVSINDLAYLSGRSLSTFKRDFKAIYNISPLRWLQQQRLKKAKELLDKTEMSVTDVCYTTGFENLSHFSKVYKSYYAHSPSLQRNNLS